MKQFFSAILSGLLLAGALLAQDTSAPASGSTPQDQQTPATAPSAQQAPEPSTSQPPASQPQQQPAPTAPAPAQPASSQNGTQAGGSPRIAPGSVIPVQLTKTIDAKKVKTGDEVVAKVTQDMKTSSGEVLVPKDTKVVGHVTEAQPRTKEQKESQVGIAFDRAVMKDGGEMPLPMSIQAIIGPQNNNPNAPGNDQASSGPGYSSPAGSSSGTAAGGSGRTAGMGGSQPPPTPSPSTGSSTPGDSKAGANARPQITGNTQGVVGMSNLKLSPAPNPTQGSVVSSEKNNVKLDSGTLLLLRVNQ